MNTFKRVLTLTAIAAISACTASVRVMPGSDDINRVVARDIEKHWAEKAAHKAAVNYCEQRGARARFISDAVWYDGTMDEDRRTAIRRQSEAATVVGGVIRSRGEDDAAVVLESVGVAGSTMTSGRDYTAEVIFSCQAT